METIPLPPDPLPEQAVLVHGVPSPPALARAAQAADQVAAANLFTSYRAALALRTRRAHDQDLVRCQQYLTAVGAPTESLAADPVAWTSFSWGLLEGFKRWMLREGYAIGSINRTLATVKTYVRLATQAGHISVEASALLLAVKGYSRKQGRHLDTDRAATRRGHKKAQATSLSLAHARALKDQPSDTPQGRRDALLCCLLLDHGLRVGEVAALTIGSLDLPAGLLVFYREKVDLTQTHVLSPATLRAAQAYLTHDLAGEAATTPLLRGSRKNGTLAGAMGTRAMQARIAYLGSQLGVSDLSPHDCRHFWASAAIAGGTDLLALQEAGGWASLEMPRRYVERAKIANARVTLQG